MGAVALDPPRPAPLLTRLSRVLALAALEATSMGLACWTLASGHGLPAFVRDNTLDLASSPHVMLELVVALVVAFVAILVVFVWKRRDGLCLLERLTRRMAPLALSAAVPLLFDWRLWQDRETVFFPLVIAFGFGVRSAFLACWEVGPVFPVMVRLGARIRARVSKIQRALDWLLTRIDAPLLVVVLAACGYAAYFSVVTIVNHRNLGTLSFDLGLEDNLMWNLVHGARLFKSTPFSGPKGSHFGHHATFFAYLLAPIYWFAPRPETLLVIQAALMGGAAVPLFLYARRHLPARVAAIVACLYLLYPPLHGANLYDFHYLPLGVFFLWLVLYAAEARRRVLAIVAAVIALSVREDVASCLGILGVFLLLTGSAALEGAVLSVVGSGYFIVMKFVVMARFKGGVESFVEQYAGLLPSGQSGFGGVIETIVGNPAFVAHVVVQPDKLLYALELLAPLLLLPLRMPIGILLVLPGFFFTLLSTGYVPLYQTSFQYTSYWTAFLFVGVVVALAREGGPRGAGGWAEGEDRARRQRALVVGLVAASLACTAYDGAFLRHDTVRGGFSPFRFGTSETDLRKRRELAQLVALIPKDAKVVASEHLVPHVSSRANAYTLRVGTYDADYILFEEPLGGDERSRTLPLLRDGVFGVVEDLGDMAVAKRGYPTDLNVGALTR